jgi:hypothetical protein
MSVKPALPNVDVEGAVANYIKLFQQNLHCYRHITLSFDSGYTART